jgi:hypothetical protein
MRWPWKKRSVKQLPPGSICPIVRGVCIEKACKAWDVFTVFEHHPGGEVKQKQEWDCRVFRTYPLVLELTTLVRAVYDRMVKDDAPKT